MNGRKRPRKWAASVARSPTTGWRCSTSKRNRWQRPWSSALKYSASPSSAQRSGAFTDRSHSAEIVSQRAAVRLLEAHLGNVERNLRLSPRVSDLATVLQPQLTPV